MLHHHISPFFLNIYIYLKKNVEIGVGRKAKQHLRRDWHNVRVSVQLILRAAGIIKQNQWSPVTIKTKTKIKNK